MIGFFSHKKIHNYETNMLTVLHKYIKRIKNHTKVIQENVILMTQ